MTQRRIENNSTTNSLLERNSKFLSATTALVVVVLSATLALLVLIGVGERIIAESLRKHRWDPAEGGSRGHQPAEPRD